MHVDILVFNNFPRMREISLIDFFYLVFRYSESRFEKQGTFITNDFYNISIILNFIYKFILIFPLFTFIIHVLILIILYGSTYMMINLNFTNLTF